MFTHNPDSGRSKVNDRSDDIGVVHNCQNGILRIALNRPQRLNALTGTMIDELTGQLRRAAADRDIRVVMLCGKGASFCSGIDLTAVPVHDGVWFLRRITEMCLALAALPQPTLACVQGSAYGIGSSLALGCDLVIADESATFCQSFAERGLAVDGGASWLLTQSLGLRKAKELAFLATPVTGREALGLGMINKVVDQGQLEGAGLQWAVNLAAAAPMALSITKDLLNSATGSSLEDCLEREELAQHVCMRSADAKEGLRSFVERRRPEFAGR
ncbi:enoyl-CoA hydratase/isomerase family protein [Mycolicibacterium sp. XJ1819]